MENYNDDINKKINFYKKIIFLITILINIVYYISKFLVNILINIIFYNLKFKEKLNGLLKTEITLEQLHNINNLSSYIEKSLDNRELLNSIENKSVIIKYNSDTFYLNLNKETFQNINVYIKESNFNTLGDYYNFQNKIKEEELKNIILKKNDFLHLIKN